MVFFMVFLARSKAENIDTMRGRLMLAWYQQDWTLPVEQGLSLLSATQGMIASQPTKGMHVRACFVPKIAVCGVWSDNCN